MAVKRDSTGKFIKNNKDRHCIGCNKVLYRYGKSIRCKSCTNKYYNALGLRGTKGMKMSKETKKKMSDSQKGKIISPKQRKQIRETNIENGVCPPKKYWFKNGHKPANYIDGRTKLERKIRLMKEYQLWRSSVFKRDNYHCQMCGEIGYVEAHHIFQFIKIIRENDIQTLNDARDCTELWDIENGITYCKKCHIKIHKELKKISMEDI